MMKTQMNQVASFIRESVEMYRTNAHLLVPGLTEIVVIHGVCLQQAGMFNININ